MAKNCVRSSAGSTHAILTVRRFLAPPVTESLQSSVFGLLQLNHELPEYPAYGTDLAIPEYGSISISLGANPDDEPDWPSFLRVAEESHPVLLHHEPTIRQQAASRIVTLYCDYHENEWRGTATELLAHLRLEHLNYFADGSFELWYSGDDPFECHDIRIELDADMRISEVVIDG